MKKSSKLFLLASLFGALAMSSCAFNKVDPVESEIRVVYNAYQSNGGTLTYEEWLSSIKGEPGENGQDGTDGASLLTGHGAPAKSLGKDGDSYVDLDTFDYYTKSGGKWTLQGCIAEKKEEVPAYKAVWQSTNFTLNVVDYEKNTHTIRMNEKGADIFDIKIWYYCGYALPVSTDGEKYYVNLNDCAYEYINTQTQDYYQKRYGFIEAVENTTIRAVTGASGWYSTSKGASGYDGIFLTFSRFFFDDSEYQTIKATYPNAGVFYHVSNGEIDQYYIATDTTNASSISYWFSGSLTNIGKTNLGFTPEITYAYTTSSSESSGGESSSEA